MAVQGKRPRKALEMPLGAAPWSPSTALVKSQRSAQLEGALGSSRPPAPRSIPRSSAVPDSHTAQPRAPRATNHIEKGGHHPGHCPHGQQGPEQQL